MRNTFGSRTMLRPTATRWRCPRIELWVCDLRGSQYPKVSLHLLLSCQSGLSGTYGVSSQSHVVVHIHVWVQCIVLENHGDISVSFGGTSFTTRSPMEICRCNLLKTCYHSKCGGFSAPRWSYQYDKLFVLNVQTNVVYSRHITKAFGNVLQKNLCH